MDRFFQVGTQQYLSVLDLLQESGTLDELGITPVREGFSNIFFPGTSMIQTRAKYFFIIPYILKDLERNSLRQYQPESFLQKGYARFVISRRLYDFLIDRYPMTYYLPFFLKEDEKTPR